MGRILFFLAGTGWGRGRIYVPLQLCGWHRPLRLLGPSHNQSRNTANSELVCCVLDLDNSRQEPEAISVVCPLASTKLYCLVTETETTGYGRLAKAFSQGRSFG